MMSMIGDGQMVERLRFFDGQRLFASDLQALEGLNREMRWLHNKSLHQPGVGSGYAVTGRKGDREVIVQPGYAIDACGREIVLTQQLTIAVPPVASDDAGAAVSFDLTVSYPSDDDLKTSESRDGICVPRGVVRLQEAPTLCWVRLNAELQPVEPRLRLAIEGGVKILLARIEVLNCQLNAPVSAAERRNARPPQLPYVAAGTSEPEDLDWRLWTASDAGSTRRFGVRVNVDTARARFRTTPTYIAHVDGVRLFRAKSAMKLLKTVEPFVLDGFVQVLNPKPDRFSAGILMPRLDIEGGLPVNPPSLFEIGQPRLVSDLFRQNGWRITWIGLEA